MLVTHSAAGDTDSPGHTISELASASGRSPAAVLLGLYEEYGNAVQVAMFYRTEEDMRAFLAHPRSVVGSDGWRWLTMRWATARTPASTQG
ncbi:MAG TPA: hypothetical protein VFV73_27415 [Streptosporangiaceae bacterium]|nr:hypothetical protein [Streptosporangiaceae bacterium]